MCATFTDDEVSKPVVNDAGEKVGVVTSVEGDIAHVRPETGAVDSIKSSIGWDSVAEDTQPLSSDAVREITDDAVRLESRLPAARDESEADADTESGVDIHDGDGESEPATEPAGGSAGLEETDVAEELRDDSESVGEREIDRGLEADPTELGQQEPEAEFNPGDTSSRTDAAVEPDDDHRSTDAAVDLGNGREDRRTDRDEDADGDDRE
ncbi:hypothetical protein [Natronorubrum texcoconense]|uniref:Uncharacterized protein n=1 Tax=Natronorubrum texcoconense TaxID=1095776 RepID=A0A1G8TAR8_9EURY|nr:hypothetical protein [Natronorubrum texcoconense]SDJ38588.1 hypothetical protein SAMN04515672_0390 [Natronorubrum texcoconense]